MAEPEIVGMVPIRRRKKANEGGRTSAVEATPVAVEPAPAPVAASERAGTGPGNTVTPAGLYAAVKAILKGDETIHSFNEDDMFVTDAELAVFVRRLEKLEQMGPGGISGIEVNGVKAEVDPETGDVRIFIPTSVADLPDAGEYLKKADLPEGNLTQEEREKIDRMPELPDPVEAGPNEVVLTEGGKAEIGTVTADRVDTRDFTFVVDGGRATGEAAP